MDKTKLDYITDYLTERFTDEELFYCPDPDFVPWLIDVVASLHNELYKEVTGDYYDYMFHWANKAGYNNVVDDYFKSSMIKDEKYNGG